jgi:restriction system protein
MAISGVGNLSDPRSLELFTDREELARLREALRVTRTVILSGPFGSGKTTLALATAETMRAEFPGGIVLRAGSNNDSAARIIAEAFPVPPSKSALLVLDEAEYLRERGISALISQAQDAANLRLLLVGTGIKRRRGAAFLDLGPFTEQEARAFLTRAAAAAQRSLADAEVAEILRIVGTQPRLLTVALNEVLYARRATAELLELFRPLDTSGLVDTHGMPLTTESREGTQLIDGVRSVNARLVEMAQGRPGAMYEMSSREFEQLVAELLSREGFEVELTPPSNDGGFDIAAAQRSGLGRFLFLVECKKYAEDRPVGVEIVRGLHGVVSQRHATAGIVATTSHFTRGAVEFQRTLEYQLSLRDFGHLKEWLARAR